VAASIDAALAEKIKRGVPEINVEIQFSTPPPAAQLQSLGLKSQGNLAWGMLSREKIQAIATVPQVVAIRLSQRSAEPKATSVEQRIGPGLALDLQVRPQGPHRVIVTFRQPPKTLPAIKDLSVRGTSGDGYLSREEIEALAKRDDVLTIELFPEVKLL
jgi:hypothetical protein